MKQTTIIIEGNTYIAELASPVSDSTGQHTGLLFVIRDEKKEVVGCISTFLSHTTKHIWQQNNKWYDELFEDIFIRIMPYLSIPVSKVEFAKLYPRPVEIFVDYTEPRYEEKKHVLFVPSADSPEEIVLQVVFDGSIDEDKVEKDILKYLYQFHFENHAAGMYTPSMIRALFIDAGMVYRCLNYLKDDDYIREVDELRVSGVPGIAFSELTTKGVRHVRNKFTEIRTGVEVVVIGDIITNNNHGDGNVNINKSTVSNSFNVTEFNTKADELKSAIEEEYNGEDEQELLDQVEEIKELAPDEKNHSKIRGIIGNIISKGATVVKIAALAADLLKIIAVAHGVPAA